MSEKQPLVGDMDGGFDDEVVPLMQTIEDDIRELVGEESEDITESAVDDKTEENWESDENLETEEAPENADDELERDGLRNRAFQEIEGQETEQDDVTQEIQVQEEEVVASEEERSGEEDKGKEDSPEIEQQEQPEVAPIDNEEYSTEIQRNEANAQFEEQLRRLRFSDETTPFTHLNSRGIRQYKRRFNSITSLEDRFSEYGRVDLPAHKAAWDGNLEVLEQIFICKHKGGVPCLDRLGATPLHIAARKNRANVIRWIMKYSDLSVMYQAARGETPVHIAAALGHTECLKALLQSEERDLKYILSYLQDRMGFTCLLLAIQKHQNDSAKILIDELGVRSVSAINESGINAAHVAASAGNVEVLRMLHSKHKKLLHQRAADGTTPVYFAAQEGRLQALRYLHDIADCDLTKASEDGLKPMHAACQAGHTSIVKFIVGRLGNGATRDQISDGATPLHFASAAGKIKTAIWLIKNDESKQLVNIPDHNGDTPCHDAAESGQVGMLRILLEEGGNLYSANQFGKTPYSLSMENENTEMTDFVQEFSTRKNEEDDDVLPPRISIFDMEGGEHVLDLEDQPQSVPQLEGEYPYESSTDPTPIPSRIFKDRLSIIEKKPSLRLWPPMPVPEGFEDEEDEKEVVEELERERGLENIEEEEEGESEVAGEEQQQKPAEILQEEEEEAEGEEVEGEENKEGEGEPIRRNPNRAQVVRVVSESMDDEDDEEEDDEEDEEVEEVEEEEEEEEDEEVEEVEEEEEEEEEEEGDKEEEEEEEEEEGEKKDQDANLTGDGTKQHVDQENEKQRRVSDPDTKGAGEELKKIFKFRKNRDNK